jgi:hypothetical protein
MSTELEKLQNYANNKSANTQRIYHHHYRLLSEHFGCDIADISFEKIKDYIESLDISANTKAMYLNIVIVISKFCGGTKADINDLLDYRADLTQKIQSNLKRVNNNLDLPKMQDLIDFANEAFKKKNYRRFVINYLLINYFVRNQDLDLLIIDDIKNIEPDKNYLVLKKNPKHIIYVRQKYKTFKQHGRKDFTITDLNFYKAVKELYDTDEPLLNTTLHHAVMRNTYNNIGESKYCKVAINFVRETGNLNLLKYISERRGTQYAVLLNSYNAEI